MKWFIKCLKHYADFSGRARRTEYWMFVLFNMIFAFAWSFSLMLVFVLTNGTERDTNVYSYTGLIINLCYSIVLMLPGMAVAVRRLHDIGKSGWMILVSLIPIIGGLWLLILMLTDSQPEENQYGPNPKTSPETFSDVSKLKSAGIVMTVVSSFALIYLLFFQWIALFVIEEMHYQQVFFNAITFWLPRLLRLVCYAILLATGILLLNEKQIGGMKGKGKNAFTLLLAAAFIFFLLNIFYLIGNLQNITNDTHYKELFGWKYVINNLIFIVQYLSITLFAVSVLFAPYYKNLIRCLAISVFVFSGLNLLSSVYLDMGNNPDELIFVFQNLFGTFLLLSPIAYIVLAGTFLQKNDLGLTAADERQSVRNE